MLDRYFYLGMSLLILVLVTAMFSTTVPARLFHPNIAPPYIVWLHGAVFYGWVLFFILQSGLVKIRKTRWHRTIGWFGLALGIAVLGLGVSTTIVMHRFEFLTLHQGQDAITSISIPLWDMVCFAVVFSLAILWRKKLEYHRRLMLIALCTLTAAAWGRMPESVLPGFWFYAGVDLLIMMGAARDLLVNRKIHRVYLIVLPLLIAGQIVISQIMEALRTRHPVLRQTSNRLSGNYPVEPAPVIGKFDGSGDSGSTGRGRSQELESKVRLADNPGVDCEVLRARTSEKPVFRPGGLDF